MVGDNAATTLVAHVAGLLAGVGTVATSRQLTAREMADQFAGAGVVAVVTGPVGRDAAVRAGGEERLRAVVTHGAETVPGALDWTGFLAVRPAPVPEDRPARPPLCRSGVLPVAVARNRRGVTKMVVDLAFWGGLDDHLGQLAQPFSGRQLPTRQ